MLPECVKPSEFTDWALTSESLEWISQFVKAVGIQKVIECGSGLSTILLGTLKLEKVLSLEHNTNWYAYTRHRLQEKGLLEYVDLQLCQLQQSVLNGTSINWYDINVLPSFAADLILVDSPPKDSCFRARYPTPHLLKAFIQSGTWLLLDDYSRQEESEIVNLWLKEIPELELIKIVPFKYGLAVLRYNGSSKSLIGNVPEVVIFEQSNPNKLDKDVSSSQENKSTSLTEKFLISKNSQQELLNRKIHQKPLVSIIIPCHNAGKMIERCLSSCLQQIYPQIEIIIVDNNSTDNSIKLAQELASTTEHRVIFTQCQQQGVNYARNHGFSIAQGDYIQWLDADDELTPNKIALLLAALELDPQFDIAYGDWEWCFYQNDQCEHRLLFNSMQLDDPLRYFLLQYWHPPHAYLLRRSAAQRLNEVQAWHQKTQVNTDLEYFTLAAALGLRFLHVPEAIVRYNHWSQEQTSRSTLYCERIQSTKQMAVRFVHYAMKEQLQQLSAQHWFLLRLNWDFWRLASTQLFQEGEQYFWLQHRSKSVGMTLTPAETRIVMAMSQLGTTDTLMGHTNQIIRLLWKQVVLQPSINETSVAEALSRWVGLLPDSQPISLNDKPLLSVTEEVTKLHILISAVPVHAPLYTEQREAILQLLDKLRVAGLLKQVMPKTSTEIPSENMISPLTKTIQNSKFKIH